MDLVTGNIALNCDLGEGFDDSDAQIMAYIDQANIACGGHAGDTQSMQQTVRLAKAHNVTIGAHPSYPDKDNFGRVSLNLDPDLLFAELQNQVSQLSAVCSQQDTQIRYIKAHGALYNDSNHNTNLFQSLLKLAAKNACALMIQARPHMTEFKQLASASDVKLILEGFADRAYENSGDLRARSKPNAVYTTTDATLKQALSFRDLRGVLSSEGQWLNLDIDSLCVHGDSPLALSAAKAIHDAFN